MKKSLKYVAVLAVLGVALASCTSFTKGYSTSPYGATSSPASQLFAGAEGSFDEFMEGWPAQVATLWAQQATGAERQFQGYYVYTTTAQDYANDWGTAYTSVLYNLRQTEQEAKAAGQLNLAGASYILEGIQVGTVTALWGAVPYSEASEPNVTLTPKFDPQLTVYSEVQATLDTGISLLSANKAPLQADIFSSAGNPGIWIAAAYTEKARLMMDVARHDGYSTADLNNVITWAKEGITDVTGAQDFMFSHAGGATNYNGNMNLWYSFGVYDRSGYIDASKSFMIPMLEGMSSDGKSNDAGRLHYYFDTTATPVDLNYSGGFAGDASFPIFRASEANLLIAEAYARLNDLANALTYLNNARQYNDNVFGDSSAAYDPADPAVATQKAMLQTILNEEYLSLFPEIQSFTFCRRVNFDIKYVNGAGATVALTPTNGTQFPQRFFYPTNELTANPNTPAQTESDLFKATTVNSVADPNLP